MLTVDSTGLAAGGTLSVTEDQQGVGARHMCNRRGTCDVSTGRCSCASQFGSSNGKGESGALGDCGFRDARSGAGVATATVQVGTTRAAAADLVDTSVTIRGGGSQSQTQSLIDLLADQRLSALQRRLGL